MPNGARTLFAGHQVRARLAEAWKEILRENGIGGHVGEIVLTPILEGAIPLARDTKTILGRLAPGIAVPEYPVRISRTSGERLIMPELAEAGGDPGVIKGRFVVILDDLTDEGATLLLARDSILKHAPRKVISLVVLMKRGRKGANIVPDYACFELDYGNEEANRKWIFGYGMDFRGRFRDLDDIFAVSLEER